MRQVNLEVTNFEIMANSEGQVFILLAVAEAEQPLTFIVNEVSKLAALFDTFEYQSLSTIKYVRAFINDKNQVTAIAHITKNKVFDVAEPSEETGTVEKEADE